MIPHEDKVDVVSPFSILRIGGGGFCSLMKIMLMYYPIQHIGHRGWHVVSPFSILVIGVADFDPS